MSTHASEHALAEGRLDGTAPRAAILGERLLGRRAPGRDDALERIEVARLVGTGGVAHGAPRQPGARQGEDVARHVAERAAGDLGLEAEAGHLGAQALALFSRPALDQVPGA